MRRVIGIDFGTSTTLIAERIGTGQPRVIPIGRQTSWMPSIVGVRPDGSLVAGEAALELGPGRVIRSAKAALTRGETMIVRGGHEITVGDAMECILREAVDRARAVAEDTFQDAKVFMGCPALWTGTERRVLADVAARIGIDVDIADIIDEPVAAGLHWVHSSWLNNAARNEGQTLIFDAGGGTLDIALLEIVGRNPPDIRVLSAEGVAESGDKLDATVAADLDLLVADLPDPSMARMLLQDRARRVKESLSTVDHVDLALGAPYNVVVSYDRSRLDEVFQPQLASATRLVKSTVRGSQVRVQQPLDPSTIRGLPWADVADEVRHVALVGGLSNIPLIATTMRELFTRADVSVVDRPQETVALGLAEGDRLDRLNLPRPPVDFTVDYTDGAPRTDASRHWADEHAVIYQAFTPLYTWADLFTRSMLAYEAVVPYPPGRQVSSCTIRCRAPDRARTPLALRVAGTSADPKPSVADGIVVSHSAAHPARFKLHTNGDLVVSGAKGEVYRFQIEHWPRLRGPKHDWDRELRLQAKADTEWISELQFDNWRSK